MQQDLHTTAQGVLQDLQLNCCVSQTVCALLLDCSGEHAEGNITKIRVQVLWEGSTILEPETFSQTLAQSCGAASLGLSRQCLQFMLLVAAVLLTQKHQQ